MTRIAFTERELDLMSVLWERGPSTVAEVRDELDADLAYNTVLTILRIIESKGFVGHTAEGRAYRYHALVDRDQAGSSAIRRIVDTVFAGSEELLLTHIVRRQRLGRRQLERLRALLDEHLEREGA